jgi:hypothetical protein
MRFVAEQFATVRVFMFQKKLFPDLSEDTYLLLADKRGEKCRWFGVSAFSSIGQATLEEPTETPVDVESVTQGQVRLTHYLLPAKTRGLYQRLVHENGIVRFGEVADIGIGYVTGCNDYFHLTVSEASRWGLWKRYLKPCVTSLGEFRGLVFRSSDWNAIQREDQKAYLMSVPPIALHSLPTGLKSYLRKGEGEGIPRRYKCRVRDPWYSVPHVRVGDAFLSYMSGGLPRLVLNPRKFVAPNTLHLVRFTSLSAKANVVGGWHSSLTKLSCEMEGHALGGGMLKLEPTEAERILIAQPRPADTKRITLQVDTELRQRNAEAALDLVDHAVLRKRFGLTASECAVLRDGSRLLERWRMHR